MGDGALGSDHINYLILRYLQEAGHENAAKALHQDWHRPDKYNDPEKLPFAPQVKQFELVKIIQDGLFHDQLQAEVTKQTPRFNLIEPSLSNATAHPNFQLSRRRQQQQQQQQQPQDRDQGEEEQQKPIQTITSQSQAQTPQTQTTTTSAHQTHAQTSTDLDHHDSNDFPIPAPKRVRKTNTDEPSSLVNGDAMLVDDKPTPPAAPGDDGRSDEGLPTDTDRAMSDTIDGAAPPSSSPTPVVETISTATQTDKKLKAKKSETMYWSVDKDGANIVHALWNPSREMDTSLLAAGDALCRFYQLPATSTVQDKEAAAVAKVNGTAALHQTHHHFDVDEMPRGSITTAACWHPSGRYATCSVEFLRPVNGTQDVVRCLFDTDSQHVLGGKRFYTENAYIHVLQRQSPTVNMALRYSRTGDLLLSVSTSVKRGLIDIWQNPSEEPVAVKVFAKQVLDAVWASDDEFIVCGENCLEAYRINLPGASDSAATDHDSSSVTGSRNLTLLYSFETDKTWGKVRYDSQNRVVAATAIDDDAIVVLSRDSSDDGWSPVSGFPAKDDPALKQISAIAFENLPLEQDAVGDNSSRRLATTHHTGAVNIYAITHGSCTPLQTLYLGYPHAPEAALALSWSPDGTYLAAASEDSIKVWNPAAAQSPVLTWKASAEHWSQQDADPEMDGMTDADDVQTVHEPSLAWDAEGKRLLFAVGQNMAVIRLLS